jgi:tetratricopeptide (TPR) repeat protein
MDRHYTRDELERYAEDGSSFDGAATLESHLGRCAECRATLDDARTFLAQLSSPEVWHFADEMVSREHTWPLVDLQGRIEREDAEARVMLRRPLSSPLRFLWASVAAKRRFRTGGVVRLLCAESKRVREENPLHARNLADAAAAIADRLPDASYPAAGVNHLRGLAWKEVANALRYLGDLNGALGALDRAKRAYARLLVHDAEDAAVLFVRATIIWKQQRLDEALTMARAAAAEFARLGDHDRWVDARLLEGSILCDAHDGAAARNTFLDLRDHALGDNPVLAGRIENNLANAYLELRDFGSATKHLLAAIQLYEGGNVRTEAARARWSLGCLALEGGNTAEAERRLRAASTEFDQLRMTSDAALVLLDLMEALLVLGRSDEVRDVGSQLVARFTAAGMRPAALTAAGYLREAAVAETLTPKAVRHVRDFLRKAESDRTLVFLAPLS